MNTQAKAHLRYLRNAPRKTRLLADVIRGLPVMEAEAQLMLAPKRVALPLLKLLRSAEANAKQTLKKDPEALVVEEIRVDQGPKYTRWMPRARGAMSPVEKKTSHVTIVLGVAATAHPSRFAIVRPTKKSAKGKKEHSHDHAHDHAHEKPVAPSKKEEEKDEKKKHEKDDSTRGGEQRGFAQRMFRRKSV